MLDAIARWMMSSKSFKKGFLRGVDSSINKLRERGITTSFSPSSEFQDLD